MGRMLLVIIDAFPKWLEVHTVSSDTSRAIIEIIRASIATHGMPDIIVSDNGSCFTSQESELFADQTVLHTSSQRRITPLQTGLLNGWYKTLKQGLKR